MHIDDIKKAVEVLGEQACRNPRITEEVLVTHDMAMDAGDPEWEGQVYHPEEIERCGSCEICMIQQILIPIVQDTIKNGKALSEEELFDVFRHTCASERCDETCPAYPKNEEYPCGISREACAIHMAQLKKLENK